MDSELQFGLFALGILAVIGIFAYNKWQERKQRRMAEEAFRSDHRDVLLEPHSIQGRKEPFAGARRTDVVSTSDSQEQEVAAGDGVAINESSLRRGNPGVPDMLDERIDCVVLIESIAQLDVVRLRQVQQQELQGVDRTLRWFVFDDSDNQWKVLTEQTTGSYQWFCTALQTVDRNGAIDANQFDEYINGMQRLAEHFLAVTSAISSRTVTLASAVEMDRLCASMDIQIGISVVNTGTLFPGTKIRALAEANGMVFSPDGSLYALDAEGQPLYSLSDISHVAFVENKISQHSSEGVTLLLDVPRTRGGVHVYDQMMRFAKQMAQTLDGAIVDDNGASLGPDADNLIREQIRQFQARLAEQQIPPGGHLAARLFAGR